VRVFPCGLDPRRCLLGTAYLHMQHTPATEAIDPKASGTRRKCAIPSMRCMHVRSRARVRGVASRRRVRSIRPQFPAGEPYSSQACNKTQKHKRREEKPRLLHWYDAPLSLPARPVRFDAGAGRTGKHWATRQARALLLAVAGREPLRKSGRPVSTPTRWCEVQGGCDDGDENLRPSAAYGCRMPPSSDVKLEMSVEDSRPQTGASSAQSSRRRRGDREPFDRLSYRRDAVRRQAERHRSRRHPVRGAELTETRVVCLNL
jgi:hypothetical protein